MPTPTKGPRLGGSPSHQRLILANLAQSLFEHGQITTTEAKARRLRPYAEHLITKARHDSVANRRHVVKVIRDKSVLHTLFTEIGPRFATRPGGYTRITKIGPRKGDNAPMALIELVEAKDFSVATQKPATKSSPTKKVAQPAPLVSTPESAENTASGDDTASAEETASDAITIPDGDAPFGDGSAAAVEDGEAPDGFEIKGNADSGKYHTPESQWYGQTIAEVWFATEDAAEAAGFVKAG